MKWENDILSREKEINYEHKKMKRMQKVYKQKRKLLCKSLNNRGISIKCIPQHIILNMLRLRDAEKVFRNR